MISVIICTYNRAKLLQECLRSIENSTMTSDMEFMVIDNNSTDCTKEIVEKHSLFEYFYEEKIGLSHARNLGVEVATNDWLMFLDDDCKVHRDIFSQAKFTILNYPYKMFTGIYRAWYKEEPPKWIPYHIGNYIIRGENNKPINDLGYNYISGGIMVINKPTLQRLSRFPSNFGMNGNKTGYGEESYIEDIFRMNNIPLGINTKMIINHQVLPYKYTMKWQLVDKYEKGKSAGKRLIDKYPLNYFLVEIPLQSAKGALKIVKHYSLKKSVVSMLSPWMFLLGYLKEKRIKLL